MTSITVGNIYPNSAEFDFFSILKRNRYYDNNYNNIRPLGISKAQYIPTFQNSENKSRTIIRSGDQIFEKIPFETNKSRPLSFYEDGKITRVLDTIKYNSSKIYPTSYTAYPLNKIGNVI